MHRPSLQLRIALVYFSICPRLLQLATFACWHSVSSCWLQIHSSHWCSVRFTQPPKTVNKRYLTHGNSCHPHSTDCDSPLSAAHNGSLHLLLKRWEDWRGKEESLAWRERFSSGREWGLKGQKTSGREDRANKDGGEEHTFAPPPEQGYEVTFSFNI